MKKSRYDARNDGDVPVDLARREWRVQEEANLDIRDVLLYDGGLERLVLLDVADDASDLRLVLAVRLLVDEAAKKHRQKHEVVVLDPDHVARLELGTDGLGEAEVGLAVGVPVCLLEVHLAGVVVEERPENGVGEAVVVAVCELVVEIDCLAGVLLHEPAVDDLAVLLWDVEARPADPGEVELLLAARERRDEAARAHLEVVLARGILGDRDGQTIRNDDQATRATEIHVAEVSRGRR